LLDAFADSVPAPATLVQIGAHDGRMADPVHRHLERENWGGILIEPHPVYFAELTKRHAARQNIELLNVGISDSPGHFELFHLNEAARDRYPRGARGCASLDRNRMVDALRRVNDRKGLPVLEEDVSATTIELRRLDAILAEYALRNVDILVVDVEGHERQVLNSFDITALDLKFAIVECNGPDVEFEAAVVQRLKQADLRVLRLGDDLVGFREGELKIPVETALPLAGLQFL